MSLKHCLNWKVIAGLGIVALGVLLVAPNLIGRVLPILLVAACPLSMLAMVPMMTRINGGHQRQRPARDLDAIEPARDVPVSSGLPCCAPALSLRRRTAPTPDLATLKAEADALAQRQAAVAAAIAEAEARVPAGEQA